jgi:hypothetical protein
MLEVSTLGPEISSLFRPPCDDLTTQDLTISAKKWLEIL